MSDSEDESDGTDERVQTREEKQTTMTATNYRGNYYNDDHNFTPETPEPTSDDEPNPPLRRLYVARRLARP